MRNLTPFTAAEETLGIASAQRGLGGMERTAAPKGPNMFDDGAASKVAVNSQPYNNARLQEQNILQNMTSALPQAQADAVHDVRKQELVADNARFKAERFAKQRTAEVAAVLGSPAIQQMSQMTEPEVLKLRNDVAVGKAMAMGANPDLVQNALSNEQYLG